MAEPVAVAPGGDAAGSDAPSDAPPAFAFEARRARMDWRAIHAVDVDCMMRENDIDTLESVLVRPWLVPRVPSDGRVRPTTTFSRPLVVVGPRRTLHVTEETRLRLTNQPTCHRQQETVTFGDISVEDSRYLTTSNARKVIRLAQCQVEYLLHVQETLAAHKERLRGVAEQAQRDSIEARADAQEHRVRARAARGELRKTRKALRTYEVLERVRSGTPLEEILAASANASSASRVDASLDASFVSTGGDENADSADNVTMRAFAKAAARARDADALEKRASAAEKKLAEAEARLEKLSAENAAAVSETKSALEALEEAKQAAELRAASSAASFEKRLAQLEVELTEAKALTEADRARAEADARAAEAAHATEAAAAIAAATAAEKRLGDLERRDGEIIAELRERLASKDEECDRLRARGEDLEKQLVQLASGAADELRARPSSTEDPATRATLEKADAEMKKASAVFAEAKAAKAEVERLRLAVASDEATAAREEVARLRAANAEELRRLDAEREREVARLMEERRRETDRLEDETARISREMAAEREKLLRERDEETARLRAQTEATLRERDAEKARLLEETVRLRAQREAALAASEAEAARLVEERDAEKKLLLEEREAALRETREKGLEEVARLREANAKLSESAEEARRAAEAARRAELETREKALKDAEASERRVIAAAAALEKEHALRALEEERHAAMRKSSPERRAASETVAAELKLLRESIELATAASPSSTPAKGKGAAEGRASAEAALAAPTASASTFEQAEEIASLVASSLKAKDGDFEDSRPPSPESEGEPPGADGFPRDAPAPVETVENAPEKPPEEDALPGPAVVPEPAVVAAARGGEEKAPEEAKASEPASEPASSAKAKKKKKNKKKKGKGAEKAPDFSEAPSTVVTASVEPESRVQEGGSARQEETETVSASAPAAGPAVAPGVKDTETSVVEENSVVAERERAEARAAKEPAETAETARLEAEGASDGTSGDEMIVHEEVSDEAARPLALSPAEAEASDRTAREALLTEDGKDDEAVPPPARGTAPPSMRASPPPLPVIPAAASIPELEDEPTPMAPPAADAAIAAEAARAAEIAAAAAADAARLRAIVANAPRAGDSGSTLGKGITVPGASPRLSDARKRDEATRKRAAEEAEARLEEIESMARRAAATAARAVARAAAAPPPLSETERRAWLAKHPYQPIAKAPYALSRRETHDADLFDAAQGEVVAYLEEQVASRLASMGAPASTRGGGLDDVSYVRMMADFRRRRAEETEALSLEERARYETERAAILNHVAATSRAKMRETNAPRDDETRDETRGDDASETFVGATAKTLFSA